jgi:hypothetical protein
MSEHSKKAEHQKFEDVGRVLAKRLHEARSRHGLLRCPVCQKVFEGTHLIKCPGCRTLISNTFRKVYPPNPGEILDLDFFR